MEWEVQPCDAKFSEKCLHHHNNAAFIKQISLFHTALGKPQKKDSKKEKNCVVLVNPPPPLQLGLRSILPQYY